MKDYSESFKQYLKSNPDSIKIAVAVKRFGSDKYLTSEDQSILNKAIKGYIDWVDNLDDKSLGAMGLQAAKWIPVFYFLGAVPTFMLYATLKMFFAWRNNIVARPNFKLEDFDNPDFYKYKVGPDFETQDITDLEKAKSIRIRKADILDDQGNKKGSTEYTTVASSLNSFSNKNSLNYFINKFFILLNFWLKHRKELSQHMTKRAIRKDVIEYPKYFKGKFKFGASAVMTETTDKPDWFKRKQTEITEHLLNLGISAIVVFNKDAGKFTIMFNRPVDFKVLQTAVKDIDLITRGAGASTIKIGCSDNKMILSIKMKEW